MRSENIIYKLNFKGVFISVTIYNELPSSQFSESPIEFSDEMAQLYIDIREICTFGAFDHSGTECSLVTLKNGDYYLFLLPPEKIQSLVNSQIIYSYKTN